MSFFSTKCKFCEKFLSSSWFIGVSTIYTYILFSRMLVFRARWDHLSWDPFFLERGNILINQVPINLILMRVNNIVYSISWNLPPNVLDLRLTDVNLTHYMNHKSTRVSNYITMYIYLKRRSFYLYIQLKVAVNWTIWGQHTPL